MADNQLFNIRAAQAASGTPAPPAAPDNAGDASSTSGGAVGVITTQQSVLTFAGAPAVVSLMWAVIGAVFPAIEGSKLLALVLSLTVGMLIYWQSAPGGTTRRETVLGIVFALINSFAIAAAALGIESVT